MTIAGIDYSTMAIDLVLIDVDGVERARLFHWELCGADALTRTRAVPLVVPGRRSVFWDTVRAVAIEEPMGRGPTSLPIIAKLKAIQGAVLACIPAEMEVTALKPTEWRAAVGLAGNATKHDVHVWSVLAQRGMPSPWPQDGHDAYCIARAIEGKVAA